MKQNLKMDPKIYLGEGALTKITPKILRIAKSMKGNGVDKIFFILEWMHKNIKTVDLQSDPERWHGLFHKRSAARIIHDGFAMGCSDYGMVFSALSRACGIPTRYLETFLRQGLKNKKETMMRGHIFAEVFVGGRWILVDPTKKSVYGNPDILTRDYIIYSIGLDCSDWGFDTFKKLSQAYNEYKKTLY